MNGLGTKDTGRSSRENECNVRETAGRLQVVATCIHSTCGWRVPGVLRWRSETQTREPCWRPRARIQTDARTDTSLTSSRLENCQRLCSNACSAPASPSLPLGALALKSLSVRPLQATNKNDYLGIRMLLRNLIIYSTQINKQAIVHTKQAIEQTEKSNSKSFYLYFVWIELYYNLKTNICVKTYFCLYTRVL